VTDTPAIDTAKLLDELAAHHVCACGNCRKVLEDALAEFQRLTAEGCIHWYMTHVTVHATIAAMIFNDHFDAGLRQQVLAEHFIAEPMLDYIREQLEAIDAANALLREGGKPN
jgi:molybdate-binding protein